MNKIKRIAGVAVIASAALLLTACGIAPSYIMQKTTLTVTAQGNVNLTAYTADATDFGLPSGSPRVIPAGSNGKAAISLAFTYDGGNWNVAGTYKDGAVQFKVKGYALEAAAGLGCGLIGPCSQVNSAANRALNEIEHHGAIARGSACFPVITHYESTNRNMPGTGWVEFMVCDAPVSGATPVPSYNYTGPDYVQVYIPFVGSGDQEPFSYYLSGGTMSGYGNSTSVSVSAPLNFPSYSPTPIYPSPVGSTPPPNVIKP
jgi:hypothetical protein